MTVVQQENKDTYRVIENFPTQKGAWTITLNSKTHRLYLSAAEFEATPAARADPEFISVELKIFTPVYVITRHSCKESRIIAIPGIFLGH